MNKQMSRLRVLLVGLTVSWGWTGASALADDTPPPAASPKVVTRILQRVAAQATAQGQDGETAEGPVTISVVRTESAPGDIQVTVEAAVQPGKYWIGVVCSPIDNELVMNQLGLEHGLVVTEVVEDSPAGKAGLQKQDILIQAGDLPLKDVQTLVAATEKAQGTELTLTIVRKSQKETVALTPALRPAHTVIASGVQVDEETAAEWKKLQESLRMDGVFSFEPATPLGGEGARMLFVMPGFVLPEQAKDFPQNLEVSITKKGEQPAQITIKRGDEQWEVTAETLDQLPEDVRPHVQRMLGGQHVSVTWSEGKQLLPAVLPRITPDVLKKSLKAVPELRLELRQKAGAPGELREKVEKRLQEAQVRLREIPGAVPQEALEQVKKELQDLRQQLEQLRKEQTKESSDGQESTDGTNE